MAKKQLVIAIFENEEAADEAAEEIKKWEKGTKDFDYGAIGVLVKDKKGKIKTHKLGKRRTGTGAAIFALAGLLSGGLTIIGGAIGGALVGSLFHRGLGMSKEELAKINEELDGGKAAVIVETTFQEAAGVENRLSGLGGVPQTHEVDEEALEQAEAEAGDTPEEEEETGDE